MAAGYILYGRQSSGSWAVQVALEEAGAHYERIWVGGEPAEVLKFRAVSPTGKVPALVLPDGAIMFESAAMLIHLAGTHSAAKLAPVPGSSRHALFLQWSVFLSANLYEAALRMYYSARYSALGEAHGDAIKQRATEEFLAHLDLVVPSLAPYLLGAEYSIADAYLHMLVSWYTGDRAELLRRLPALALHAELISVRPAVVKVQADHVA